MDMVICADCKGEFTSNYQTIQTKRNTTIHICDHCIKKYKRKEVDSAGHSKKPT